MRVKEDVWIEKDNYNLKTFFFLNENRVPLVFLLG
jgi:hypothetical protein